MINLNIGSGGDPRNIEGVPYTNVDIREHPNVDVVSDIRKLPFEDNYADGFRSWYAIEHLERKEIPDLVKEWKRVVKPGGWMEICTADWEGMMDRWREIPWEDLMDGLYGAQNYPYDFHKVGFTADSLQKLFDLDNVEVKKWDTRGIPRMLIRGTKK